MRATATKARDVVQRMQAYTLELRDAATKLNQNESPFDFPETLKREVLARAAKIPWNVYPDFEAVRLRSAIAEVWGFSASSVLVGNGSNELLAATMATFIEPGRRVALARPTFALYEKLVSVAGGEVIPIDLDPRSGLLPLDALVAAVERDRADVVIVCSPNNPTGGVLPKGGIDRLLATGAVVLFDRAYGDFHDGGELPSLHERLVVFSTFSKAWGLAALRLGWLVATEKTCREIRKVKLPYSLNVLSQEAALVALGARSYRDANVDIIVRERERMFTELALIAGIEPFPTCANFVTFRCLGRSAREVFEQLCTSDILIRDLSANPSLPECLRVSIGSVQQNENFRKALRGIMEDK